MDGSAIARALQALGRSTPPVRVPGLTVDVRGSADTPLAPPNVLRDVWLGSPQTRPSGVVADAPVLRDLPLNIGSDHGGDVARAYGDSGLMRALAFAKMLFPNAPAPEALFGNAQMPFADMGLMTDYGEDAQPPAPYVDLNANMPVRDMLNTLLHELVHVGQTRNWRTSGQARGKTREDAAEGVVR